VKRQLVNFDEEIVRSLPRDKRVMSKRHADAQGNGRVQPLPP
jgi:hypothetical protein